MTPSTRIDSISSGTKMAQQQLRVVVGRTGAMVLDEPQLMVTRAGDVIQNGEVRSQSLREEIRAVVQELVTAVELCADEGSPSVVM